MMRIVFPPSGRRRRSVPGGGRRPPAGRPNVGSAVPEGSAFNGESAPTPNWTEVNASQGDLTDGLSGHRPERPPRVPLARGRTATVATHPPGRGGRPHPGRPRVGASGQGGREEGRQE